MSQPYDPNEAVGWDPSAVGYTGPPSSTYPTYPGQPAAGNYGYPGYPQPGYPNAGYGGAGFPPGYGPPPYSIYGPLYRLGRPGQVVGTAVLSYIEAGLLTLTGVILFSGSSIVSDFNRDGSTYGWGTEFALAGFGDLLAAGLLIAGGVMFSGGQRLGRLLVSSALAICLVEAIFWIYKLSGAITPWAIFYLILPVIGTSLSYSGTVREWLDRASPARNSNQT